MDNTVAREDGWPDELARRNRRSAIVLVGSLVIVAVGAGWLTWSGIFGNGSAGMGAAAVAFLLWYTAVVCGGLCDLRTSHEVARIVPYFEREVPGGDTFNHSGHALARACKFLDAIAAEAGLTPMSGFGFRDNFTFLGEWPRWHEVRPALESIDHVLDTLSENPDLVPEPEAVIADLERLQGRLVEAHKLEVRFCLHLRADQYYTGEEFAQRRGRY